ncbi:hypothetical protein MTR67_010657, partial [Solanum verrucosum]
MNIEEEIQLVDFIGAFDGIFIVLKENLGRGPGPKAGIQYLSMCQVGPLR